MKYLLLFIVLLMLPATSFAKDITLQDEEFVKVLRKGAEAKVTLSVVDDDGTPVTNATVRVSFAMRSSKWINGVTDTNGVFGVKGQSTGEVIYTIRKDGYYETSGKYEILTSKTVVRNGKWQPWNPTLPVVLRRTIKPIPMYAKLVETSIPILDTLVGYDLETGDWVSPYGDGVASDVCFQVNKKYTDIGNFYSALSVVITNCVDGLQSVNISPNMNSSFELSRLAPQDGYSLRHIQIQDSSTNYYVPNSQQNYYFRVRTETNMFGEVTASRFGKIRGYFDFDVRRENTSLIRFTYYLNPTQNDRNLEFSPGKNLFPDQRQDVYRP